jgi:hypothetical protein
LVALTAAGPAMADCTGLPADDNNNTIVCDDVGINNPSFDALGGNDHIIISGGRIFDGVRTAPIAGGNGDDLFDVNGGTLSDILGDVGSDTINLGNNARGTANVTNSIRGHGCAASASGPTERVHWRARRPVLPLKRFPTSATLAAFRAVRTSLFLRRRPIS